MSFFSSFVGLALILSSFIFGSLRVAYATNGINLLAASARGQGLAGATTAVPSAVSDSLLANPSLLRHGPGESSSFEFSVSGLFLDTQAKNSAATPFGGTDRFLRSRTKFAPIPTAAYSRHLGEGWVFGTGLVAESGLASDQRERTELLELKPEFSVAKLPFAVSRATAYGNFGVAPSIGFARYATNASSTIGSVSQTSRKQKTDSALGIAVGYSLETGRHSFGAGWKSRTRFKLEEFADLDAYGPVASPGLDTLRLDSPSQWNLGYSVAIDESWRLFLDVKRIHWGSARGFRDYGWENQWVSAIAAEFSRNRIRYRGGLNLSTPVYRSESNRNATGVVDVQGKTIYSSNLDFFNVVGYPAILTRTLAIGATVDLGDDRTSSLDLGVLHSFRETIARSGTGAFGLPYAYETRIQFTTVAASYRIRY